MAHYYDDLPAEDAAEPEAKEMEGEESAETTALLPKSILAGKDFKPGDRVILRVVHLYDDEVEVAYAKEEPKPKKSMMDESEEGMDKYARM